MQETQQAAFLRERLQGAFALGLGYSGALRLPDPDFRPIFKGYLTGNRIKSA